MNKASDLLLFVFLIVILGIQNVFATMDDSPMEELERARNTIESAIQVVDRSPYDIWNEHDLVIDGTIIDSVPQKTYPVTLQYELKVNKYFKPTEQPSQLITAIANETSIYFEPNTRALFYLKKLEGGYIVSTYSVKTSQNCSARDLIQISPVLPNDNSIVRGAHTVPWNYKDMCVPDYFSYDPDFWTFRDYKPPLRQFRDHNLPIDLQRCHSDFESIHSKNHPEYIGCVKPETAEKLVERGWGKITTSGIHLQNN